MGLGCGSAALSSGLFFQELVPLPDVPAGHLCSYLQNREIPRPLTAAMPTGDSGLPEGQSHVSGGRMGQGRPSN